MADVAIGCGHYTVGRVERSGEAALVRLAQTQSTSVLVGCELADMSGTIWVAQARQSGQAVALVGAHEGQAACAEGMREAGTNAFVIVGPAGEGLAEALRRTSPRTPFTLYVGEPGRVARLPLQQYRTLRLISAGLQNREIAFELGVKLKTVEWHAAEVFKSIGVSNRAEATRWAVRRGVDL